MWYKVAASSSNPVTTAQAKTHLRVLHSRDDTYIGDLVTAATAAAEAYAKASFIRKDVYLYANDFGGGPIEIEDYNPVRAITSIVYLDTDGTTQLLSTGDYGYEVKQDGTCRIYPAYSTSWPAVYGFTDADDNVRIRFSAGPDTSGGGTHGTTAAPAQAVEAIRLIVGDMYTARQEGSIGTVSAANKVSFAAKRLLDQVATVRY